MDIELCREIVERVGRGEHFAVGLLVQVQGSAPQKAGARLLVFPDGTLRGTVGGGCLEMETRRRALLALRTGETSVFELRLDDDFGWDDGLICGGKTTLLVTPQPERMAPALAQALVAFDAGERRLLSTNLTTGETQCTPPTETLPLRAEREGDVLREGVRPHPHLYVLGCGHIGAQLGALAATLGFQVTAVDDRPEFAAADKFPAGVNVRCEDLPTAARCLPTGPDTYWVIVTRGHRNDGKVLAEVIGREWAYCGMIGSRRKVRLIREGIVATGLASEARFAQVRTPIGLDIGAETPREIAVSILAELIAVRRKKTGPR